VAALTQGVVGEVEHMIGLVIRQMNLEQVQAFVDGVHEPNLADEGV
jgi:hypothetical protein